jgi:dihydrofolate reductase
MITLDGVMQAPGAPEEDTSGGFKYGGWTAPYGDEKFAKVMQEELKPADYLLGRKTFDIWEGYWPQHGDFWPGINEGTKYIFSKTLKKTDPRVTGWENTVVIRSMADIRKLKSQNPNTKSKSRKSPDIQVWGSSKLIQLLLEHDLVDELRLKIYPLTLGKGKKLFGNGAIPATFQLTESLSTSKGVIIAIYKRAGEVKTEGLRCN